MITIQSIPLYPFFSPLFFTSKSTRGQDHPTVASVLIRLADLYCKTGKLRESKSYCENALRIYAKPAPGTGTTSEEIASGLTEISTTYEALNETEVEALLLLIKKTWTETK